MVIIRAAFDASYDQPKKVEMPATSVAGYVGYLEAWEAIEPKWNAQLEKAGIERFHLNDFRKKYRDTDFWMDDVRPFAEIIQQSGLTSVTANLWDADWHAAPHPPEYLEICPRPVHGCLDMLFNPLADELRLEYQPAPATIVFDNDFDSRHRIVKVHDAWCERTGNPRMDVFLKGDQPWDAVPLQCADLLAGIMRLDTFYRHWLHTGSAPDYSDNSMLFGLAGMVRGKRGRGVMWSAAIGNKVEEAQRKANQ